MNKLPQKDVTIRFFGRLEFGNSVYYVVLSRWPLPCRNRAVDSLLAKELQHFFFLLMVMVKSTAEETRFPPVSCFLMRIPDLIGPGISLILTPVFLLSCHCIFSPQNPSVTTGLISV